MSTPKILSVVSYTARSVQTDVDDFPHFTRHSEENWTQTMGESEEPIYNCEGLEKAFQYYIKNTDTE